MKRFLLEVSKGNMGSVNVCVPFLCTAGEGILLDGAQSRSCAVRDAFYCRTVLFMPRNRLPVYPKWE